MFLNDPVGNRKPKTRPAPDVLRREKRIEDARQHVRREARSRVADGDGDAFVRTAALRRDLDAAGPRALRDRVLGVDQDVEKRLLQVQRIA